MVFRVEITARAQQDLIGIARYIQTDSAEDAKQWFAALQKTIASLQSLPERGTPLPGVPGNLRVLLYGNASHIYRLLYRVDSSECVVYLLHVRHGARSGDGL